MAEQRREGRIRGQDRASARRRLEHRFVQSGTRTRLIGTNDDVGSCDERGDLFTWDWGQDRHARAQGVVALDASLQFRAVRPLVVIERRSSISS